MKAGGTETTTENLAVAAVQRMLLGEAVDAALALVFVADETGRYIAVNERTCNVLVYTREELLGMRVPQVAIAADATDRYTEMIRTGRALGETTIRSRDGRLLTFRYEASQTVVAGLTSWVSVGFVV